MKNTYKTLIFILLASNLKANNIQLSNISVSNNGGNTGKVIQFDLSWENSWRTSSTGNYDGAWVFFKFKDNDGTWRHLNFTGINNQMPAGASYEMGNNAGLNGVGMFIFRSANGFGNATVTGIKAGITSYPGTFEVKGFAIEMVYIPTGNFWLGDGVSDGSRFTEGISSNAYEVTGNGNTLIMGSASGNLYDQQAGAFSGNIAGYPTGYEAFWMMKYELSQGAYRDFLNTLTYDQQATRFAVSGRIPSQINACLTCDFANNIQQINGRLEIKTAGSSFPTKIPAVVGCDLDNDNIYDEPSDGEWQAMSFISWPDAAAYLDWAGLRPMTEMEYEKVARGPLVPVPNEYVWGNTTIATNSYTISNNGNNNQQVTNAPAGVGNALYLAPTPASLTNFRGGIFASAASTRTSAGAGYYGAMEMAGNLGEFAVFTWNAAGRSYSGKKGDGILDDAGNANENKWPGINDNNDDNLANANYGGTIGVSGDAGIKIKGGYMGTIAPALEISSRNNCGCSFLPTTLTYSKSMGIRGVRDVN